MTEFEPYIGSIESYVKEMRRKGRKVRELIVSTNSETPDDSRAIPAGSRSTPSIILKSDTFLELGAPGVGSFSITLYSDNPTLISDGRITQIGPDVSENAASSPAQLPFGQVILVAGENMGNDDYYQLLQSRNLYDYLEGYMVRSTAENIWSRVSNEAAQKGFNFLVLGTALMHQIKNEQPKVQSVEILFVTSSREDVAELQKICSPVKSLVQSIKERIWQAKGVDIYACKPGGHCGACADKAACDAIKQIGAAYKKS